MKVNDMYPSPFLKADDLGDDAALTIQKLTQVQLKNEHGEEEDRWALHFLGVDKALILNKTNANEIASQLGDETDAWKGKQVTLTVQNVTAFGKTAPAIRVKPRRASTGILNKPKVQPQEEPAVVDGETPF